eukprot:5813582-Alexandrium_andersonii.AAC.1
MSASLVGSEMCIRDSGLLATGRVMPSAPACVCLPVLFSRLWRRTGAVSYTHLTLPTICSV